MNVLKWAIGGGIAGLIGAAIWGAVGYYSGYEVGWIAWGIGFLVGLGVRIAAQDEDGYGPGIMATAMAVGAVLLGKYLVISWSLSGFTNQMADFEFTDADMISSVANEVAAEYEAAGRKVVWPEDLSEDASIAANYPPDVWAEAAKRWNKLSPDEKQLQIEERKQQTAQAMAMVGDMLKETVFRESFTAWDLLWIGLAAFTAFKLGSGLATGD